MITGNYNTDNNYEIIFQGDEATKIKDWMEKTCWSIGQIKGMGFLPVTFYDGAQLGTQRKRGVVLYNPDTETCIDFKQCYSDIPCKLDEVQIRVLSGSIETQELTIHKLEDLLEMSMEKEKLSEALA